MKQICLGTDYDGLINAIDNCKFVDKLDVFKNFAIIGCRAYYKRPALAMMELMLILWWKMFFITMEKTLL